MVLVCPCRGSRGLTCAAFFALHCTPPIVAIPLLSIARRPDISSPASRGLASILARGNDAFGEEKRPRGLVGKDLSAHRQRAIHERSPAGVLPREALRLEGGYPQGGQGDLGAPAGRERKPSRSRRPRLLGNRPGDRTARPR